MLVLAMAVTSITYTPVTTSAAEEWTALSGFSLQNGGTVDLAYRVFTGSESQQVYVYGAHYVQIYPNKTEQPATIYFDEGLTTEGNTPFDSTNGFKNTVGTNSIQFGFGLNNEKTIVFQKDKYYSLRLVYSDNSEVVYQFKVGTPTDVPSSDVTESEEASETPETTEKTDYSGLEFTAATGSVGTYTYAYNVVANTIPSWVGTPEFLDNGLAMQIVCASDNKKDDTKITINGVEKTAGTAEVPTISDGLIKFNPSVFEDNAYTNIVITTTTGSANIILRKGNPSETPETTTEEQAPDLSNPPVVGDDAWVQVTSGKTAQNGSKYYYQKDSKITNVAELQDSGKVNDWGGGESNTVEVPAFVFSVNTGDGPKSIWLGTKKLSSDTSYIHSNVMTIAQSEFDLGTKEEEIFYVTLRYADKDEIIPIKVVAEKAPDLSSVTLPGDVAWTKVTNGTASNGYEYYYPAKTESYDSPVTTNVMELKNSGKDVSYVGTNNTVEAPAFAFTVNSGVASTLWLGTEKLDSATGCISNDIITIAQSKFDFADTAEKIFYVTLRYIDKDVTIPIKVVNPNYVEVTTGKPEIKPVEDPADAVWTEVTGSNGEYLYYVPADSTTLFTEAKVEPGATNVYISLGLGAPYRLVQLNGIDIENSGAAFARVQFSDMKEYGAYKLHVVGSAGKEANIWIKKVKVYDYKPTGLVVQQNGTNAVLTWVAPSDKDTEGYQGVGYTVKVGDKTVEGPIVGETVTVDMADLQWGSYDVTVNTIDTDGKVLGSTTTKFEYRDPDKVNSTLNVQYQWEGRRRERLSWNVVDGATGYAIYADGKLFTTTTDAQFDVYAYAFANVDNSNGDKTTVGDHTTKVVALFDGEEAPAYENINEKHVIGEKAFVLYVNYIFGRYTDIWNQNAEKSLWAFTICEDDKDPNIAKGADAKVVYNADGSANVTINDVGRHRTYTSMETPGDQAWTIKVASYDAPISKDQLENLSYDIMGPASLIGKTIRIKVCPEETDENGVYLATEYLNKYYTFEDDGNGGSIIHFTETFTSTNDTYDMFFGLGLLQDPTNETQTPIELTIEEAKANDVYGVTSATASPVYPTSVTEAGEPDHTKHGIMVQWETDVPFRLRKDYTYEVYINGKKTTTGLLNGETVDPDDAITGTVWYDYECGGDAGKEYTVEVRSFYHGSETHRVTTTAVVRDRTHPDLVISNMVVENNDTKEYYTGDKVPVVVTIKNISTIDAVVQNGDDIAVHLYLRKPDGTLTGQEDYFIIDADTDGNKVLKGGQEVTKTMYYTVDSADAGENWRYTFVARADADGKVNEGNYENNNDYVRTFIFPERPDEVTFNNDGTNVSISWPGSEAANHYRISYVSNGETKSIETRNNDTTYVLDDVLDNGSTVEVYSVRANGAEVIRATGTAYADLVITDIGAVGIATVNKPLDFKGTVKNIGFARATASNNENIIALTISGSDGEAEWSGYDSKPDGLAPNQTVDITLTGKNYIPKVEGKLTLTGNVNDNGRIPETDRKAGPIDTENNNNRKTFEIDAVPSGTLNLVNVDGKVYADFTLDTEKTVQMYSITYTSNGVETTDYVNPADVLEGNRIALNAPLDNLSTVSIAARYTAADAYFTFARDTAKVDLTVSKIEIVNANGEVLTENFTVDTYEEFYARTYITNIGTAQVKSYHSDNWDEEYANAIFVAARDADGKMLQGNKQDAIEQYNEGLLVGATATIDVGTIQLSKQGIQTININVDDPGWDTPGYITESNEENNTMPATLDVHLVQQPMDWTPLKDSNDTNKIFEFEVANSSLKRSIEYKVLDTSYTDIDYRDLVTKATGYNGFYMSIGFEDNHKIINVNNETGKMSWSYTNTWFQQVPRSYLVDKDGNATGNKTVIDNEYLARIPSQGCDIYGYDGKFFENTSETPLGYNGNGFNFNVNSFAPGKYYMMSIVDYDEKGNEIDYITLAFRVTTELEGWTRIGASDATDIDKLAAFYHTSSYQLNGRFYYNCSDLGLACIKAYNGTHITLTTDTAKKLNDDINKTKLEIAYGVYDEATNSVVAPENWNEVCVNPGIYGKEGTNNLQIDIASMTRELPIHSAKGGETDYEYYFLKVYYDTENEPDSFIPVPFMIATEIPEIIPPQGLTVSHRGNSLGINWTSTAAQVSNGYLYDLYVNGKLINKDVEAGDYFYTDENIDTVGTEYEVKVVAKWCYDPNSTAGDPIHNGEYQQAESVFKYIVQPKQEEPEETIPADKPDYPRDDKWVLINGQCVLPVTNDKSASGQTVEAQIWYYTDVDMYNVVGYNDYYISLNGNKDYFTGQDVMLYVQNGDGDVLASKKIYDKYYSGQILMNAADMFTTYGDWNNGDELYYRVRIAGDGGNTYKDFYFKIIPNTDGYTDDQKINAKGDWRLISGDYTLPVSFSDLQMEGTISFLDCPISTEKYTGTNTYDIIGYNNYYIAMNGSGTYYTGNTTKIEVSEPSASVLYAEDATNLTFTEKPIYDKTYSGQIQINAAQVFTVAYDTTYFLVKITGSDAEGVEQVTYVPVKIEVTAGDVEVQGYQMNTDASQGAVSEYNPSFRVVSKTSKVMLLKGELKRVTGFGTVYALNDDVKDNYSNMKLDSENIYNVDATEQGVLNGWTSSNGDHQYNTYYAVTLKHLYYSFTALTKEYAFRAYAKLEDGTVVYGNNVYSVSIEEIAENLYQTQKMKSSQAHEFLYNNVLNKIAINNNRLDICKAMLNALKVPNTSDPNYEIINGVIKSDLYDYVYCKGDYNYSERNGEGFVSLGLDEERQTKLLSDLNAVRNTKHKTLAEWMYNEVENYKNTKTGITYKGFYRKVAYDFDAGIYTKFDTE